MEAQEPTHAGGGNSKVASQWGPRTQYSGSNFLISVQSIISTLSFSPGWILIHAAHRYTPGPPERSVSVDHKSSVSSESLGSAHGIDPPPQDGFAYTTTEVLWTLYPAILSSNSLQIATGSLECKGRGEVLDERGSSNVWFLPGLDTRFL